MAPVEQYRIASREDEIALARSASPPSISGDARVLVLGSRGYETAVKGKNGFVCFVERSWAAGFDDPEFWNPKLRAPNCFNPPAARTELPQYLKRSEWVLAGATRQQIINRTRAAVASHDFKAPEPGAFSFMLSKNGYLSDDAAGPWLPHVMFFLLHGQANDWGANKEGSPIVGRDGSAIETTILVVPVRSWSDGSPAPPPPEKHLIAGEDQGRIKAALEERYKEWLAAENRRDAETLTNFYDDNAVLMPSKEEPVIGKAAIGEWHKKLVADPRFVPFTLTLDWNSFHLVGDVAITTAVFEGDLTRDGRQIHFRGKALLVWKKQKDTSWKIFRYMYDEIPAKK